MKLEILEGPAGSGKTAHLLAMVQDRAKAEEMSRNLSYTFGQTATTLFVVPDQATFIMEKRVLETLGDRIGAGIRVFSLSRLARHILSETGGETRPFLDASGKGVLVYRVVRALADQLPLFSDAIRKGGFSAAAANLISECRRYGISPEQLSGAAEKTGDARLAVKLRELALMAQAVQESMTTGGYQDGEDLLMLAAQRVSRFPDIGRLHLVVDQFQRLSPMQLQLVGALTRHMASVTVTLRLSQEDAQAPNLEQGSPGRASRQILQALLAMAAQSGVPVVRTCTASRNLRHPADSGLSYLAGHLSASRLNPQPGYPKVPEDIHIAVFPNPEEELHACCERILSFCRDEGCRYRDLAVLIPDTTEYAAGVRRIFRLHDIPFFLDRKESLAGHPVSVALLAIFDVLRGGWRHDDVFRLLKTGMLPIPMDVVDRLENVSLATGLRGKHLWCGTILSEPELEQARLLFSEPLAAFRVSLHGKVPIRDGLEAYLQLLLAWRIPQTIARLARQLSQRGELTASGHMRQIWQSACNLMDQILELGSSETITLTELHGMLQSGLEAGTTSIIPPSLEEVFVGTPSRSQLAQVRHLFVLGTVEGWIPSLPGGQGLLSDMDRRRLRDCGLLLAPDAREAGQERRDEVETVLAMSTDGLWISRPISDMEGKALHPSSLLEGIHRLFPWLREGWMGVRDTRWVPEMRLATTPRAMLERLAPTMHEADANPESKAFRTAMLEQGSAYPELHHSLRSLTSGMQWRNSAALDPDWMWVRYGNRLNGSISALEQYRRCPFSWFARYVAGLREREEAGLRDVGFGLLLHGVLDALVEGVVARGGWETISQEELDGLISEAVAEGLAHGTGISPLHPGLAGWFARRIGKAARIAAFRVYHQIRGGQFRPAGHELGFGEGEVFPPFCVPLENGGELRLRGRLDRMDIHEAPDGRYIRVVDYKSGDRALSLSDIANGLSMQLPAYLTVALSSLRGREGQVEPIHPAGIFHMRLEPPDIRMKESPGAAGSVSLAQQERNKRMRLSGYVLDDPTVLAAMDADLPQTGTSTLLKAGLNKNGSISANTKTLSETGFSRLGDLLERQLSRLGSQLLCGEIPVHPVRVSGMKACDYCPYQPVCRFEPGLGGVAWDRPPELEESAIRVRLEQNEGTVGSEQGNKPASCETDTAGPDIAGPGGHL